MTSNIGSHLIQENMMPANSINDAKIIETTRTQVFELLRKTIRPEFLNRVDEIIMFQPLTRAEIRHVVELQVENIKQMLEKNNIRLFVTKEAVQWIADKGFDPVYGARPIKRVLQRELLNNLSKLILQGIVEQEGNIVIDTNHDGLVFANG